MARRNAGPPISLVVLFCCAGISASAQSFMVQCPTSTQTHPLVSGHSSGIKCQQISGGDGYATMGDGTQTYLFAFGPLSGLKDIAQGKPGTQIAEEFNKVFSGAL